MEAGWKNTAKKLRHFLSTSFYHNMAIMKKILSHCIVVFFAEFIEEF